MPCLQTAPCCDRGLPITVHHCCLHRGLCTMGITSCLQAAPRSYVYPVACRPVPLSLCHRCATKPDIVLALPAGSRIVIEEFLRGEEASFFALVDGETCVGLLSSQVGGLPFVWADMHAWKGSLSTSSTKEACLSQPNSVWGCRLSR